MKLTTKSEYTLLLLLAMVRRSGGGPIHLNELARETEVPLKYAEQLFALLKKARIVNAKRGVSGGYRLMRPPHLITLAEVIRLMDGALAPTEAVSKYFFSHTPLEKEEKLLKVFREIRNYVSDRLESLSLADMA